ncbi:MAG: riboflavin synthase [Syntrophomonadaceae bacterium]|jgi:riboflavin synthase|nr:riboflavin synthase [Syntrophomonadaceae bacterium]
MFTGIIEELGRVMALERGSRSARLAVAATAVVQDVRLGDSIAVNGVCLTVVDSSPSHLVADVMAETLERTTLGHLRTGEAVNLERALRLCDRLGGHLVTGHVDGVGRILEQQRLDIALLVRVGAPPPVLRYAIPKGSIAVDGVSLTLVNVDAGSFVVSLIPHTAGLTTLGHKHPGDLVNLEADIIGKYVERLLAGRPVPGGGGVDLEFLQRHGFMD